MEFEITPALLISGVGLPNGQFLVIFIFFKIYEMQKFGLFLFSILFSCASMLYAQRTEVVIKFKDGTKKIGYGKLISKSSIAFRESLKEKTVEYDFADCEYVDVIYKDERERYRQFPVRNETYSVVVQEQIYGTLSLYVTSSSGYAPTAGNFGTAMEWRLD